MKKRIVMVNSRSRPRFWPEHRVINSNAKQHIGRARMKLIQPYSKGGKPYLATALMRMKLIEDPGYGTLGVDSSWRLYYDPLEIIYWPIDALSAVIEHEVWHLLRQHHRRAQNLGINLTTGKKWNIAADTEIHSNRQLLADISRIPNSSPHHPEMYGLPRKKTVEFYYQNIPDPPEQEPEDGDGPPGEGEGDGDGEGRGGRGDRQQDGDGEGRGGGRWYENINPARGVSGSGADGIQRPRELAPTDEIVSRAEERHISRTTAETIQRDIRDIGRSQTGIGDDLSEWADSLLEPPKVDWRDLLRNAIDTAIQSQMGNLQYTWRRLSRRQVASPDFMLPGMDSPVPEIAVVLDSSGSMYAAATAPRTERERRVGDHLRTLLNAAMHEVGGILEEFGIGIGVNILVTTTAVQFAQRVYDLDDIQLVSGGGTEMGVGLEAAAMLEPPPNVIICLTDGYTAWPGEPPEANATYIIAIVGSTEEQLARVRVFAPPAWADEIIYIDEL